MKLLTKEEEDAHYRQVLKGGTIGGILGLAAGAAGVVLSSRRSHTIRNLTLPMKSFLVTSSGTFAGIIAADNASRRFEAEQNQQLQWYENRGERLRREELARMSFTDRAMAWAKRERYTIVGVTWVASMIGSFALVGRNPYLTGAQKIVQARVYAQGLTVAVLIASAAFEISDRRRIRKELDEKRRNAAAGTAAEVKEDVVVEEEEGGSEQGDLWKEMVQAEEERLKKKHISLYEKPHQQQHQHQQAKEKAEEKVEEKAAGEEKN